MDCSGLSPFQIDLLNFAIGFIPWVPAVIIWLLAINKALAFIAVSYPGEDNRNRRTAWEAVAFLVTIVAVYFLVWGIGLSLMKRFACSFS